MRNSLLCEFDASFAVSFDLVASDIWVALSALDDQSVVAARSHDVLPDLGCTELGPIRSCDFDTVLMGALNLILDDVRLVIVDLDSHFIQIELVADYLEKAEQKFE